jgi:hypothetical protein
MLFSIKISKKEEEALAVALKFATSSWMIMINDVGLQKNDYEIVSTTVVWTLNHKR